MRKLTAQIQVRTTPKKKARVKNASIEEEISMNAFSNIALSDKLRKHEIEKGK